MSIRANTSPTTTALASWGESPGRVSKTAPSSHGEASAKGRWSKPARATDDANEPGAVTTTSWPARSRARAKGTSGPKWPAPAVVANRTRMRSPPPGRTSPCRARTVTHTPLRPARVPWTTNRTVPAAGRFYDAAVIPWVAGPGVVEFPDGRRIRGRGLRRPLPHGPAPEFGLYLLARDPGPFTWDHRWVRWPDLGTPASTVEALAALRDAYERAATQRVEIAGGVGRTGTALAAIAALAGVPRSEAVAWVRHRYHRRAAETPWQRRWVLRA